MSSGPSGREYHYRRVRHRAHFVSWLFAPLVPVAISGWLLFNLIVCSGGYASPRELLLCRHAHVLPDCSLLFILIALGFLLFGMHAFGEELLGNERDPNQWRVTRYRQNIGHAYTSLDRRHQDIVFLAYELTAWALAALALTFVFWMLNWAFPLGLLVIAAIVRTIMRLIRRFARMFPTPSEPKSPRVTPTKPPPLRDEAYPPALRESEARLIDLRRAHARPSRVSTETQAGQPRIGFALSGGGIRSATFCLGVFQALAKLKLLHAIDYVSSVSGGGYFASFLGRLFSRSEINDVTDVEKILSPDTQSGPEGSMGVLRWLRENGRYLSPRGSGDLLLDLAVVSRNWAAVQVVIAVFVVLLFLTAQLVRVFVEINLSTCCTYFNCGVPDGGSLWWWSPYWVVPIAIFLIVAAPPAWAYWLVQRSDPGRGSESQQISPWFGWALTIASAGVAPWVLGRWDRGDPIFVLSAAVVIVGLLAGLFRLSAGRVAWKRAEKANTELPFVSADPGGLYTTEARRLFEDDEARKWLSNLLKAGLVATAVALAFTLIDSAGQTVFLWIAARSFTWRLTTLAAALYSAVIAVAPFAKWIVSNLGLKTSTRKVSLPYKALAGAAAALVMTTVLVSLDAASHAAAWRLNPRAQQTSAGSGRDQANSKIATPQTPQSKSQTGTQPPPAPGKATLGQRNMGDFNALLGAVLVAFGLSFFIGRVPAFLNRSTLHPLYSGRLTRAYLGASNKDRYKSDDPAPLSDVVRGDDIAQESYWPPLRATGAGVQAADPAGEDRSPCEKGAPLHLLNVTINETLDGRSQVQQQDRKGLSMAFGPAAISAGVRHHAVLNLNATECGKQYEDVDFFPKDGFCLFDYPDKVFKGERLSLGEWAAISGAAFSTGLGFRTNLGLSFLAGFFNVRLGYWWDSGLKRRRRRGGSGSSWSRSLGRAFTGVFPVQSFLFDEFLARFHGTARRRWYLSDGGHFENMGAYELVRRRLETIVVIDAEADPDYTYEGLANLVSKAREDFNAEITFLNEQELDGAVNGPLRRYFGTLEQMRRGTWVEEPVSEPNRAGGRRLSLNPVDQERLSLAHAALARIHYDGSQEPGSTLLLIKPTLTGDEPADVHRYHLDHPSFPQETTAEQFFNESQWESYRKLGEHIAAKLFSEETQPESRLFDLRLTASSGSPEEASEE